MIHRVLFAGFAFAAVMVSSPGESNAYCRTTTARTQTPGECATSGALLNWENNCIGFSVFVAGSPEIPIETVETTADEASAAWHLVACDANSTTSPYFVMKRLCYDTADGTVCPRTSTPTGYSSRGQNANTVSFNPVWRNDASHRLGTIAITIVTFDTMTGEILDADVEMNQVSDENPDGYSFTVGEPTATSADLPTILVHEFGHFHGIAHSPTPSAVMWPEAGLGEQRRTLVGDDVDAICDAYNPANAPANTTCNPVPYGGFAQTPNGNRVTGTCTISTLARPAATPGRSLAALGILLSIAGFARSRRRR